MSLDSPTYASQRTSTQQQTPSIVCQPASSESRRRISTSKSMHNLSAANKAAGTARQLFPSASKDSLRSAALAQAQSADGAPQRSPRRTNNTFFGKMSESFLSPTLVEESNSAPSSPTKRSAAVAFSQPPSQPPKATSRPSAAQRTATAPPALSAPLPKYNLEDEDNLPSPFIKKKQSSAPVTRSATAGSRPPPVPSRALRPSGSRLSLASKLAIGRTNGKVDEQGRLVGNKAGVSATLS